MKKHGSQLKLENYAEVSIPVYINTEFRATEKENLVLPVEQLVKVIEVLFKEAGIKSRDAFFSIPDFTTFFTIIELPQLSKSELKEVVKLEARKYIPVPLEEITLDWELFKGRVSSEGKIRVLLVAIPNEVLYQYQQIASSLNLKVCGMEAEAFSLSRAVAPKKGKVALIDIGERSTTCNFAVDGSLLVSYSLEISGFSLIKKLSQDLSIDYKRADELKRKIGLLQDSQFFHSQKGSVQPREVLLPIINSFTKEIENIFKKVLLKEGKEIEKIILAGGNVNIPGLIEYFKDYFKKPIEIANPFKNLICPPQIEEELKKEGSVFAIAVGLTLR